jgi:hypothetical protein
MNTVLTAGKRLRDFNMRIVKSDALAKYMDIKKALYFDTRCIISPMDGGLICVLREPNGIASKRQREWMYFIFDRIAKRELGEFEITESESGHFCLSAIRNEKNSTKKNRKEGEDKSTSEQESEGDISGQTVQM